MSLTNSKQQAFNMEILVDRKWKKPGYTISKLYVNGVDFGCNVLEDTDRGLTQSMSEAEVSKIKVYGQTAIPTGTYNVIYSYSNHFKKYMPLVENVKGFQGIRIHSGNVPGDTLGCLLIGKNDQIGHISNSRLWTDKLVAKMKEAWAAKEKVTLIIK